MNSFRTVGLKLTLALAGLLAGALAIVYLAVIPSLEDRLIKSRLDQLEQSTPLVIDSILASEGPFPLDLILATDRFIHVHHCNIAASGRKLHECFHRFTLKFLLTATITGVVDGP